MAVVLSFPLWAQDYRARIQGVVTDPSNAVVVGATVTLVNEETAVKGTQKTNESGHYLFDLMFGGHDEDEAQSVRGTCVVVR